MSANEDTTVLTREEYTLQLRNWIDGVSEYNNRVMYELVCAYAAHSSSANLQFRNHVPFHPTNVNRNTQDHPFVLVNVVPSAFNRPALYQYTVPPMWKRVIAELIDFLILFVIKMFLTIVILESLDVINVENYGFSYFYKKLQDPKFAMQMSLELLVVEVLHRIIVCCYETYWIVVQCATPGKQYMGLAVIRVLTIAHVNGHPEDVIIVTPGTSPTLKDAIIRALLKNIFIGLLLPICCVLVLFKHNRTGYDLLTNSLVVEYNTTNGVQQNR